MNQVWKSLEDFKAKKPPFTTSETNDRIEGEHCDCEGNGNFVLIPKDDPAVMEGGKAYMRCVNCGCWSHL